MKVLLGIATLRIQYGTITAAIVAAVYVTERFVVLRLETLRWITDAKGARRDRHH